MNCNKKDNVHWKDSFFLLSSDFEIDFRSQGTSNDEKIIKLAISINYWFVMTVQKSKRPTSWLWEFFSKLKIELRDTWKIHQIIFHNLSQLYASEVVYRFMNEICWVVFFGISSIYIISFIEWHILLFSVNIIVNCFSTFKL